MALDKKQADVIKKQLLSEIDKLPQENKEELKKQILDLNEEQLEKFLEQNNIQLTESGLKQETQGISDEGVGSKCIFCSIVKNQIPSYKIAEQGKAIGILEINPLSKGHSIVLPLEHVKTEKLPKSALSLAQKIAKKIKTKLKPEDVKIETSSFMGHSMINIIPIYKDGKLEKHKAEEKELKEVQNKLVVRKRAPRKNIRTERKIDKIKKGNKDNEIDSNLPQISFRVP